MLTRFAGIALALVWMASQGAARKNDSTAPAETRGENESVVITATLYAKPEAVKEVVGSDLGGHYIVVAIEVTPRFGKEVAVNRDDFVLKTDKDGEKSGPFAPSQIAGRGAMIVRQTGGAGATGMHDNDGPIWGGMPGTMGQPRRVGGDGVGSAGAPEGAEAKTRTGSSEKEDPMLAVLKQKELPETKTDKPVSGLLYFPMEKQKAKDLELRYAATDDKITMRFRLEKK
ncbi:MAG TPA: hypothetical protein VMQ86_06120 [Bryobacteraceae bacterium]|jgi:hypothetical protein|nr:hypothetical protein [Bryobacteraceae bacterium]